MATRKPDDLEVVEAILDLAGIEHRRVPDYGATIVEIRSYPPYDEIWICFDSADKIGGVLFNVDARVYGYPEDFEGFD